MTNVLLIGSNFLSAQILTSLCGHDNTNITIIDRKDPLVIRNINQEVVNIVKKYCYLPNYTISYRDVYEGTRFGDSKRNIFISFLFKDWVHEDISDLIKEADVIIHSGSIYDTVFATVNQKETVDVNILGMMNVLQQLRKVDPPAHRKRLVVFMSSINVYGDQSMVKQNEITEDATTPNPKDLLNVTLYTEENLLKALCNEDTEYMIFRLGTLCGYFTPHTCLVTSAVTALLDRKHHPEYTVYNGENSIELLDMNDLGMLVNNVYLSYRDNNEAYQKSVNQVYNIKCEEPQEKNVRQIVEVIMTTPKRLPHITREHGIKGLGSYSIKSPKIVESFTEGAFIKFGKPVSAQKAHEKLGFLSMKPLVYSLVTNTVQYVLTYILTDIKANERLALKKIFYLPTTPTPEEADELETPSGVEVNKDVKQVIRDVNESISKAFDNEVVEEEKK